MMQALLADRFKLAVHFETRVVLIFAIMLAKPGKLGPQLRLHRADDPLCVVPPTVTTPGSARTATLEDAEGFPERCGGISGMKPTAPGRMRDGGRDVTISQMGAVLTGIGNVGRPILDKTGLQGHVDYNLEWGMVAANVPNGVEFHPDESAPTFEEALKEQLGLKLVPEKGPADFFFVDHIEHPSAN
jgi:uncharacterized protein (TIGR03435 family)